jgi:hypothetical protein
MPGGSATATVGWRCLYTGQLLLGYAAVLAFA